MPAIIGYGAGLSIIMTAFDYTGGSLFGYSRDPTIDEYDRKEALRKNRRRPIQETIEELGEGRGWRFAETMNYPVLTHWQVYMHRAMQTEEHKGSRRHMGSTSSHRPLHRERRKATRVFMHRRYDRNFIIPILLQTKPFRIILLFSSPARRAFRDFVPLA